MSDDLITSIERHLSMLPPHALARTTGKLLAEALAEMKAMAEHLERRRCLGCQTLSWHPKNPPPDGSYTHPRCPDCGSYDTRRMST